VRIREVNSKRYEKAKVVVGVRNKEDNNFGL
jgi:hypothetical protein